MKKEDVSNEYDDDYDDEDTQKDKYLTFRVSDEEYGLEIKDIIEIVGIQKITQIPDVAEYLKGVINLRGKIVPVIDVRLRFGFPAKEYEERTCIVIVDAHSTHIGLIVDSVSEVVIIPAEQIDDPPHTTKGSKSKYIQGLGRLGEQVKILLNLDILLKDEDLVSIDSSIAEFKE